MERLLVLFCLVPPHFLHLKVGTVALSVAFPCSPSECGWEFEEALDLSCLHAGLLLTESVFK